MQCGGFWQRLGPDTPKGGRFSSPEATEESSPVVLKTPKGQQDRAELLSTLPGERVGLLPRLWVEEFPRLKLWGGCPVSFILDSMSDS